MSRTLAVAVPAVTPPGSAQFLEVAGWVAWAFSVACIVGILVVAIMMAVKHNRGEGGSEHLGRLGWVLLATVIGSSAGPLVTAVTT